MATAWNHIRRASSRIALTARCIRTPRHVYQGDVKPKEIFPKQSRYYATASQGGVLSKVRIRQVEKKDVPTLFQLFDAENWNYSLETVNTFADIAGESFLVAEVDGEVVGSMMANLLDEREAFGGLAVITPELRGKGIAKLLWAKRAEKIGERNFGVKSVLPREEILKQHGYSVSTYKCPLIGGTIDSSKIVVEDCDDIDIVPTSDVDFQSLIKYDADIHTIPRRDFVEKWLGRSSATSLAAVGGNGSILGYGVVAEATHSFRICPLFADTPLVTKLLLKRLLQAAPKDVSIDMYLNTDNEVAKEIMKNNQDTFKIAFELRKMFTKRDVFLPEHHKVFAYSSVELALV